ncbi:MAG TPA: efflux RND transporter periplasmic adaptor subunit [Methylomirabilota bacterium]
MTRRRIVIALALVGLLLGAGAYHVVASRPAVLVLTGIVTTNDVVVSPQIGGQIGRLLVNEGDTVKRDQLLALITPDELAADRTYYTQNAEGVTSQVRESEAALRYQEQQTRDQIRQAEAMLASTESQRTAAEADLEIARLSFERNQRLVQQQLISVEQFDQARTSFEGARAKVESLKKQADAQRAAVALARSTAEQIAMKRHQLETNQRQEAAATAQKVKAEVRLGYTEIRAPIDGIVDVRAVRPGEVVTAGQPLVSLINQDDLWVRVDVEESYIDRVRLGDRMTVRLPSGVERPGVVFFRGVDASFATQRDVSRTKRDIKTFEVRLRVDNSDRRLAVGMTAYVLFPVR